MASRSDNLLKRDYWLGVVDARPLALFRIGLGAILLQDLWPRFRGLSTFLTDDGIYPRDLLPDSAPWSLFRLSGDALPLTLLMVAGTIATIAFTLGFATRFATAACWLFWVSIHRRVPVIHTGGDALADIMLFFGVFADLSGRWSLDALRLGDREAVPALVPRFMQAIPGLLYLYTARNKLIIGGKAWFFGPIVFEHMHLQGWLRPGGVALGDHPGLCAFATGSTIVMEFVIPVLLFLPVFIAPARAAAVVFHLGLQLGILMTMKVGTFTYVMLDLTFLWLLPGWIDAVGEPLARRGTVDEPRWTPGYVALNAFVGLMFFGTAAVPVIPRHLPGFFVTATNDWMALGLNTRLFTSGFPSVRWESAGVLADGTPVEPLPVAAPAADFTNDTFLNNLWMQVPYRLTQYEPLGRFVCDRYNRDHHPALRSWTLGKITAPEYPPGGVPPEETRTQLLQQECQSP
jgi:uncharacterized membrane protein YphA (DoxX/SURF4 family)